MKPTHTPDIFGHQPKHKELPPLDLDLSGFNAIEQHIREHLPNAKTAAQRDAEILNNEHAIRRWMEGA
jgi:hypothetical protein